MLPRALPAVVLAAALAASGCASTPPLVVDASLAEEGGTGVISDFDDTIAVSHVLSPLRMLWEVLFTRPEDVRPVEGVARAFDEAEARGAAPFVYVSASPTFLRERISSFLAAHGLPDGPLVLKDWVKDGPFSVRSKQARIEDVLARMPARRFVLVGDSGQEDPEIYADVASRFPDRIAGIVIVATRGSDLDAARFDGMVLIEDYAAAEDVIAQFVQ